VAKLLLDVDGVLSVNGRERKPAGTEPPLRYFYPTDRAKTFMHWAWENFSVYWLSSLWDEANDLAHWAHLPAVPVLKKPNIHSEKDWKLAAVKERFAETQDRVVWVEDAACEEAREFFRGRDNWLFVRTETEIGIEERHVEEIARFAGCAPHLSDFYDVEQF